LNDQIVDPVLPTENLRLSADDYKTVSQKSLQIHRGQGSFAKKPLCDASDSEHAEDKRARCARVKWYAEEEPDEGACAPVFEMLQGSVGNGWRSEPVKRALDLCLFAKRANSECPANVDIATYKAEFRPTNYEGRIRPYMRTVWTIDRGKVRFHGAKSRELSRHGTGV